MRIAIAGPIATQDIKQFLPRVDVKSLPPGYSGAPLMGALIGGLLARGHEVCAFTTSVSGINESEKNWVMAESGSFSVYYCHSRKHAFRYSGGSFGRAADFFSLERSNLRDAILSAKPDLIHAHWSYEFGLAAIATKLPHVVTCHDSPGAVLRYMFSAYRVARYLMARQCLSKAKFITAVSPYISSSIERYASCDVSVIPNPLSSVILGSPRIKTEDKVAREHSPIIATVINGWGGLKNAKIALCAFSKLKQIIPQASLRMYGVDYQIGGNAEQWARNNGLDSGVEFVGPQAHSLLQSSLREAHILLHPSLLEGCPMGIGEAMAVGLPVVAGINSGGVPWVVGEGGLLVDVRDADAVLDAILALIRDHDLYELSSERARQRANNLFKLDSVVSAYESVYADALSFSYGCNRQ